MTAQETAEPNTILRCTVGSGLHGVAVDGTDDRDEMGICVEPAEYVIGLRHFEQWVYRTQPDGVRSRHGDLDLTVYGLRKWMSLALKGNPSALVMLFAPPDFVVYERKPWSDVVRSLAPAIASRKAGAAFMGYMVSQKERLLGERGQMRVKRPELVDEHGFDTKYAGHILRLAHQGVEYMQTGRLTLPLPEAERAEVVAVRTGEMGLNDTLTRIGELEHDLRDMIDSSPLPPEPDYGRVNTALIDVYQGWWRS